MNTIIFLVSMAITILFGPKVLHMSTDLRYDTSVTWGSLLFCLIAGVIPFVNTFFSIFILYALTQRLWYKLNIWKFLHKPIFPKKKVDEWTKF